MVLYCRPAAADFVDLVRFTREPSPTRWIDHTHISVVLTHLTPGSKTEEERGRPYVLCALLEAPAGRVVNRGGWAGRKSVPLAEAAQVRGPSFDGVAVHRVDHQKERAVLQAGSCVATVSGLPRER